VVEVGSHLYARAAAKANSAEPRWARLRGGSPPPLLKLAYGCDSQVAFDRGAKL